MTNRSRYATRPGFKCLLVVGFVFLAVMGQAFAGVIDNRIHLPINYGSTQPPAAGSAYVDPVFGSTIKRISSAITTDNVDGGGKLDWIGNEYSTASPFNSDNSRMILVHQNYFGLYDGDGIFLSNLPLEINASSEPRWSRKDRSTLYYLRGNQLKSYNLISRAASVVHAFSEYSSITGKGEMELSQDGDHFVLVGDSRHVFLYTISTDGKGAAFDTAGQGFDSVYVSPNNNVTITWNRSGSGVRFTGIELFDGNMNFLRQVARAGGHMQMSRDVNGDEVLVWTNSGDAQPSCGQNAIVKIRLADGAQTCLLSLDWSLAVHISAADSTWAFVETYAPADPQPPNGWHPYTNELLQIKLDGTEIRRLGHHVSRPFPGNSYNYMPKLTVSHDGTRLAYASNFSLQKIAGFPTNYSDTYLMVLDTATPATPASGAAAANAASYRPSVAPGSIVAIFGSGLASAVQAPATLPVPTSLADVQVAFNNVPAPLFYVSPTQINAQVPFSMAPGAVVLEVKRASATAVRQTITVVAAAPGIFSTNQQGTGPGTILRDDYRLVSQDYPAHAGDFVSIFCTGLGAVKFSVPDGSPAPNPAAETVLVPEVRIGDVPATVTFSGLAPGFVGLYQVNIQIPANTPKGNSVPVVLTSGGVASNTVTVVIQ